jgi:NAD(P)H dehydrogenase (quinone)
MSNTLLVTGAAGQLGQSVIRHLIETFNVSPSSIIAATRSPDKLSSLAAKGVVVRKADFDDPAKKAGVKHILYTSMPSPDKSLVTFAPDHLGTEQAIKASGIGYTILRNAWYIDNYLMGLPHSLKDGKWYTAAGEGRVPNISREDCALAIAAALASATTESAIYTLTGDQPMSVSQVAAVVTEVTGKPLDVVQVNGEQLAGGMTGAGLPKFVVDMLVSADANIRAGNFEAVSGDFKKLTGKDPQTLKTFLEAHKAALIA